MLVTNAAVEALSELGMRNFNLKLVAPLMYLACHVGSEAAFENSLCPGHEALLTSKDVLASCKRNMPESSAECWRLVHELSNLDAPTTQQKYDLAIATRELAVDADQREMNEMRDRVVELFRSLHEEDPQDVSVLFNLYLHAVGNEELEFLRRILQVAPDCSEARGFLLRNLGFHARFLDDLRIPENVRAEISQHIRYGYDLASEKVWKMRFGSMIFNSSLGAGQTELAKRFQESVLAELGIANFRYDDASRTENLLAICDYSALQLGFTERCLDAIEQSLARDVSLGGPFGDDVLKAIKVLGIALAINGDQRAFDEYHHPATVKEYDFVRIALYPQEAVRYAIRLGDLIRAIPGEMQTLELYRANYVFGKNSNIQMLEEILNREPDNAEVKNRLKELRAL